MKDFSISVSFHTYEGNETNPNERDWDDYKELDVIRPSQDFSDSAYPLEFKEQITKLFECFGDTAECVEDAVIKFSDESKSYEIHVRLEEWEAWWKLQENFIYE